MVINWVAKGSNANQTLNGQTLPYSILDREALLRSFHLNGHSLVFHPQTQKLDPYIMTQVLTLGAGELKLKFQAWCYAVVMQWLQFERSKVARHLVSNNAMFAIKNS